MKAYTDIEQSKKLAEILPIESADMTWVSLFDLDHVTSKYSISLTPYSLYSGVGIPCWSLSALLSIINNIKGWYPGIDAQVEDNKWQICMFSRETGSDTDLSSMDEELVDVCYEIIVKLHEQKFDLK